jgi:hypothetical protein
MQARWTADELTSTHLARMVFLDQQAQKMKQRLLEARPALRRGTAGGGLGHATPALTFLFSAT